MRVGILGAGSIASVVVDAFLEGHLPGLQLVGIAGRDGSSPRAAQLAERAGTDALSVQDLLDRSPEWVLEAASGQAVKEHLRGVLDGGAGMIVISSGGLLDPNLWPLVREKQLLGRRVVVPSGGIAGLDGVAALAAAGGLESVQLTTTKPPASLHDAPFILENGVDLSGAEPRVIFEGNVFDAVRGFPANINIAATVSLAGLGPENTRVHIIADPAVTTFRHQLEASGTAGRVKVEVDSLPNPANPRSSYLVALSAVAALQRVVLQLG